MIRNQGFKRCRGYVKQCMHRRRHFRKKRSQHLKGVFLAVMIYSVVFVDQTCVDDGELCVYEQISDYQPCNMECVHDVSQDSYLLEDIVPILDQHASFINNGARGSESKRYAPVKLTFEICIAINRFLLRHQFLRCCIQ